MEKELNELGQWITDYAKGELNLFIKKRRKTTTGKLRESLSFQAGRRGEDPKITFGSSLKYSKVVHYGRKAGTFPPPEAIKRWMKEKPIRVKDLKTGKFIKATPERINSTAFLIGRKIKEKGIEGFPYYTRAIEKSLEKRRDLYGAVGKKQVLFYFNGGNNS